MENNERKYIGDICYIQLHSGGVLTRIADGMSVKLSATEYKILSYFLTNPNQDLSLMQIANFIWGSDHEKDSDSIKSQITHIRSKLNQIQPGLGKKCIVTNRGFNTYTMKIDQDFPIHVDTSTAVGETVPNSLNETALDGESTGTKAIIVPDKEILTSCGTSNFSISSGVLVVNYKDESGDDPDNSDEESLLDQDIEHLLSRPQKDNESPTEKKIADLKGRKFVSTLSVPGGKRNRIFCEIDVSLYESSHGKQFSIPNSPGAETILYEVSSVYDYPSKSRYLVVNPMEFIESDNHEYRTFFWDNPNPYYIIIMLSFVKGQSGTYEVYINNGILHEGRMKILKQPKLFRFNGWYFPSVTDLNGTAYDVDNMTEEVRKKLLEESLAQEADWEETDLRNAPAIIIDPENVTPVLREVYFDQEAQTLKARVKMISYKGYFVFQVQDGDTQSPCIALTNMELGHLYRHGIHGFPKDLLMAVRHFEKDGTPNSIYQIAGIFSTDEELRDKDMYLEYLQMAADLGAESAIAELAEYHCRKGDTASVSKATELFLKNADSESTIGNFLFACCMEKGLLGGADPETIFDCYFKAACNEFQPALARLKCNYSDLQDPDVLYSFFLDSLKSGTSNVDYCLGCTYFYGYGLYPRKKEGLRLLLEAAERRDKQAIYAVFDIYDKDSEYQDKQESLKWLIEIEKFDPSMQNKLAMRLSSGIGCDCNNENDAIAFSLFQKAADSGDEYAINNLGWAYKEGRGCTVDYARAMELFHKAGVPASLYHLGDMYENGLGVDADIEKAIELYETASERGNKKAKKRLAELRNAEQNE